MRSVHGSGAVVFSEGRGAVRSGIANLVMAITFLVMGVIFLVVGFLVKSWIVIMFITFAAMGGIFSLLGVIFLIVWLSISRPYKIWWNSLPQPQKDFYLSLNPDIKSLYRMHLEGKLSGMGGDDSPAENTPVTDMQGDRNVAAISPELVRNLGDYIAGSGIELDGIIFQGQEAAGEEIREPMALENKSKEEVLSEYKEIVKRVWSDGQLSEGEKAVLDYLRSRDDITMEDHQRIENDVLSMQF